MKPQLLLTSDFAGAHNNDLEKTRERLEQRGSWRKQRIVVLIPAGRSIPTVVALSHWNLIFPPNNSVARMLAQGLEVGEAYSAAIEQILEHSELSQWEYLLTAEHDNLPPRDGVLALLARMEAHPEFACIGGLYFTKGKDGVASIWGDPADPVPNFRPQLPRPGQLVECCGAGMGFSLFRLSMFRDARLRRPWFKTPAGKDGVGTQDLYFWSDARKYGYRSAVDCAVKVGHYDESDGQIW